MNLHIDFEATKLLAFTSFFLLGYGYLNRDRRGHAVTAAGWVLLAIYWLSQIPVFLGKEEVVNAIYAVLAQPFFLFLAYHERLNMKWDEDFSSLRFMAGMAAIAGSMYFIIHTFEDFAAFFIREAAHEAVFALNALFDQGVSVEATKFNNDEVRVPIGGHDGGSNGIAIILACTALQSIVIFIGAIKCSRGDRHRRFKAFMWTVPVIWLLNMVRNVAVIYLVYNQIVDFHVAHDDLSRWVSLIVLIILAFIMFEILPELHEDIIGLAFLYRRRQKGDAALLWEEVVNPRKKKDGEQDEKNAKQASEESEGEIERNGTDANAESEVEIERNGKDVNDAPEEDIERDGTDVSDASEDHMVKNEKQSHYKI